MTRWIALCLTGLCLLAGASPAAAVAAKDATGALFAASDGKGEVRLWWFPPLGRWPDGGWRLEEAGGRVLVERIAAGAPDALQRLSADDAKGIAQFVARIGGVADPGDRRVLSGLMGARAMGDWDFARAFGVAWTLTGVSGRHTYRILGLDRSGRPAGIALTSVTIDAATPTPLPASPRNLRAKPAVDGVALFWEPPPQRRELPAIAYRVERDGGGARNVAVTPRPIARGLKTQAEEPGLVDTRAPLETELTYRVQSVDVLGRAGAPATVTVFATDLAALEPPPKVLAKVDGNRVTVEWTRAGNPHTAGFVVERGLLYDGPYEVLTPGGLPAATDTYEDRNLRIGTAYYYRVRSVNGRGDVGNPSRVALAQPGGAPVAPATGLRADVANTRVRLTWTPVKAAAGYFIERAVPGDERWERLNPRLTPEPLFDDQTGFARKGRLRYRIVAVGWDSTEARPGEVVEVQLPDTAVPAPPQIVSISGAGGRVHIEFVPAEPAADSRQFLLLRGGSAQDPGLVIGDPLPADARRVDDGFVEAGQDYWYRLVAVDAAGNRSEPGRAVVVRVGAAQLPAPPRPEVRFIAEPFPRVEIRYGAPPAGLSVMVEGRAEADRAWLVVDGPVASGGVSTDSSPPKQGRKAYRLIYRAANGALGVPSETAEIARP